MSMVTLISGGLDSTVMAFLAREEGIQQYPLFIDYGQLNLERELKSCEGSLRSLELPKLEIARLDGYGRLLPSGITDRQLDIYEDAFLPCRNLLFLTVGAAYAYQVGASSVGIGLLNEAQSLFPDQTRAFLDSAAQMLSMAVGCPIRIVAPLMGFTKGDIVRFAKDKGISNTYSCHAGGEQPCGVCIACREYEGLEV